MNRRCFLAAIGAAILARRPIAVARPEVRMMSDLIFDSCRGCILETDPQTYRRNFRKMCRLLIQTGPFVLEGSVVSARRDGNEYVLTHSDELLTVEQSALYGHLCNGDHKLPDELFSSITGIPLASRTPVPAWAFRNS
jgi:hypothetical protein